MKWDKIGPKINLLCGKNKFTVQIKQVDHGKRRAQALLLLFNRKDYYNKNTNKESLWTHAYITFQALDTLKLQPD